MVKKLMFDNKKILILGMARSGYEAAKYLSKFNNTIILNDGGSRDKQDQDKLKELESLGVTLIFDSHPDDLLDNRFDYVIKNPGIRNDHKYVLKAKELGIPVTNEAEMAYRLLPDDVTLIGITGTNGKTTTTTLTYEMIKKSGKIVHLAGNIGYPLCSFLEKLESGDIIVMEVSCQQLANMDKFNPHITLMTNLSEAHIDFFGSYDLYKKVKLKLFKNQRDDDIAILNIENDEVIEINNDLANKIQNTTNTNSKKKLINEKMESDKLVNTYKKNLVWATNLLKENPEGLIIGTSLNLTYDNVCYLIIEGFNQNFKTLNPNYLIKWKMINDYKNKNIKYINLNAVSGEFTKINKYSGLNEMKLGFNSLVTEYIGEFELIISPLPYNLYKNLNKEKKSSREN